MPIVLGGISIPDGAITTNQISTNGGARNANVQRSFDFMDTIVASVVKHGETEHLDHESAKLSLNALNTLAETTRILAETGRIEAARLAHAEQVPLQRRAESEVRMDTGMVQDPTGAMERATRQRRSIMSPNIFSGRSGYITWRELEDMSDERLEFLDKMLKRIVVKVCVYGLSWENTGLAIHEELVEFGFQISSKEGCRGTDWGNVANPKKSDLSRIIEAVDFSAQKGGQWYASEMLQVVWRLMEARGFQV